MNKTAIVLAIIGLVAIMTIGVVLLALFRPDATATVITFTGSILATLVSSIVIIYGLNRTNEKVDRTNEKVERIERQTNGINTALLATVTGKSRETIEYHKGENSD